MFDNSFLFAERKSADATNKAIMLLNDLIALK